MTVTKPCRRLIVWGEEGKKLFIFQRSDYLNSSLALDVEKKPCEWKSSETTLTQSPSAAVADLRRSSPLNLRKVKWTFTACSPTESTAPKEEQPCQA